MSRSPVIALSLLTFKYLGNATSLQVGIDLVRQIEKYQHANQTYLDKGVHLLELAMEGWEAHPSLPKTV